MQISTIKNLNFEKPFRNPSNRTIVNFLKKFLGGITLQKNLVQSPQKWFWRKSKEKKLNYFRKFTKGIKEFGLGQKNYFMPVYLQKTTENAQKRKYSKSQSFFGYSFFRGICLSRHQQIWNQHKIQRFLGPISTFWKFKRKCEKTVHFQTFCKK